MDARWTAMVHKTQRSKWVHSAAVVLCLALSAMAWLDQWDQPAPPSRVVLTSELSAQLDARQQQVVQLEQDAATSGLRAYDLVSTEAEIRWLQPEEAPQRGDMAISVGQVTVLSGSAWEVILNVQGRRPLWVSAEGVFSGTDCQRCAGPDEDWVERGLCFTPSTGAANTDAALCAHTGEGGAPAHVHARPHVRVISDGAAITTTYRLEVVLSPSVLNVYRLFGDVASPLKMQATALWRHHNAIEGAAIHASRDNSDVSAEAKSRSDNGFVGGVASSQQTGESIDGAAAWDSFLTVGVMVQDSRGRLSSRGLRDHDLGQAVGAAAATNDGEAKRAL